MQLNTKARSAVVKKSKMIKCGGSPFLMHGTYHKLERKCIKYAIREFRIRDYLVTRPLPEKRAGLSLKQAILSLVSSS